MCPEKSRLWKSGCDAARSHARGVKRKLALDALEPRLLMAGNYRSFDGSGNNRLHLEWGTAGEQLLRTVPAEYADGVSAPAGVDRPNPREISNVVAAEVEETLINRDLSDFIYVFGQFLDHDLDLTVNASVAEPFNVPLPQGDAFFDPDGTGAQVIRLNRSAFDPSTGTGEDNPRQQINELTSFLDGSVIYGSDEVRAAALRTFQGGKLKTSEGNLLPFNTDGLPNDNATHQFPDDELFVAGDVRANENIELSSMHTLFVREHNRLADQIARRNPNLGDEDIFQRARAIVGAELQVIAYREWLPALLGRDALPRYRGYNPEVNPGIANEFSAALFRLGHSLLGNDVEFLDNNGEEVREELELADAFFHPGVVVESGIEPILKYLATDNARELDNVIVDGVRNFLFGAPGAGGFDLASLNIQRGRDHGLADYNAVRAAYGRRAATTFADITSDVELQEKLRGLYGNVDNIDLWVGALAEDHVPGASVGPTLYKVLVDQFTRLRDGDRYWYQRSFSGRQLAEIEGTTLSDVIRRNTTIDNIQDNAFFFNVEFRGRVEVASRDRTSQGVPGVTVELLDDAGDVMATTPSNRDGRYVFDHIHEPGQFTVRVVAPAGYRSVTPSEREIEVTRGKVFTRLDFGLARRRSDGPRGIQDATDDVLADWSRIDTFVAPQRRSLRSRT